MEDQTAISQIKQGNLHGLEVLVTRYQEKAIYAAYLILQNRVLAEDIAQNAFLKVYDKIHQFSDGRPFYPWFIKIIINDALKLARKQSRFINLDGDTDHEAEHLARWLVNPQPSPEEQIEAKDKVQALRNALYSLSAEQRAVVVMRYYLEMNEAEMATRMQKPVSTIKWWLRAARKRLGILLKPSSDPKD